MEKNIKPATKVHKASSRNKTEKPFSRQDDNKVDKTDNNPKQLA